MGYGLSGNGMRSIAPALKALNTLHYAPHVERAAEQADMKQLECLRTRLSGAFDLFL